MAAPSLPAHAPLLLTPRAMTSLPRCMITTEDMQQLLAFLSTPLGLAFLQPTISNNGLVVEVTGDGAARVSANYLCSEGPFSKQRAQYITALHFVFFPKESTTVELHQQAYMLWDA